MENSGEFLIQLIGNEVCGNTLSPRSDISLSDESLFELYRIAKAHDITHIAGSALINNNLLEGQVAENLYRENVYYTAFRYENQQFVLEKVCEVLENAEIPYIPLKGSVIKNLYPQPWMRTGCDIDILVHEDDVDSAAKAISEQLDYSLRGRGNHDVQILSTENVYVELHFSLIEEDVSPAMAKVLDKVWEHASSADGGYRYELDDAMFYFYHIAHMAKHFLGGGCGIKPFLDLWLMEKNKNYHTSGTKALLKKGKLTDFADTARTLSEVWFSGKEHNRVTRLMEEFIFSGGCFGSKETKMLSEQQKSGGRLKYVLSRIFVPYGELKKQYPIVEKHKNFIPICEICRLFSLVFGKKKNFRKTYLNNLNNVSDEHIDDINLLFESVGL